MITNIFIYFITILFLLLCGSVLWKKCTNHFIAYYWFIFLLIPSFLLLYVGIYNGIIALPKYNITIHGYRIPLTGNKKITIGSDATDTIQFHHQYNKKELIEPRLSSIFFDKKNYRNIKISQLNSKTPNVVEVNGLPIRSLKLIPQKKYYITFKEHDYSLDKALEVIIKNRKPIFKYKNKKYSDGFSKKIIFDIASLPIDFYEKKKVRHLGWANRIDAPELEGLLKQSALYWINGNIWLAANDAEIMLNGKSFPNERKIRYGDCDIKLYSRQLGKSRWSISFRIKAPIKNKPAYIELKDNSKKSFSLNNIETERIVLTGNESPFRQSFDIFDYQFPKSGYVIKKEGYHFIFRGEKIQLGKMYSCGKVIFSIDDIQPSKLIGAAWYCFLFLFSVFFYPAETIKKEPVIAIIISTSIFIIAFKQLFSFRAWQGEPFNQNAFMDSAMSPVLFIIIVFVFAEFNSILLFVSYYCKKIWNKFSKGDKYKIKKIDFNLQNAIILLYITVIFLMHYKKYIIYFIIILFTIIVLSTLSLKFLELFDSFIFNSFSYKPIVIFFHLSFIFLILISITPLLGGQEIIGILPWRIRPDILIQTLIIFFVAFLAEYLRRLSQKKIIKLRFLFALYFFPLIICLFQGVIANDLGFILCTWPPLLFMLFIATWDKDERLIKLITLVGTIIVISIYIIFNPLFSPIDSSSFNRILFTIKPERLKGEYFFDYLAQLPVIWSSSQGILGSGFFNGVIDPSLYSTCINDHVASVFIQGELGAIGSILITCLFIMLCGSPLIFFYNTNEINLNIPGARFRIWIIIGLSITILWTAIYMFAANMGLVPLTGKNLPLLGLDSKNDIIRYGIFIGFIIRYIKQLKG